MRNFKFFDSPKNNVFLRLEPMQTLTLMGGIGIRNNEFCFQFNDNEPIPFADGTNNLTITINPDGVDGLRFEDVENNQSFRIFARNIQ